ncbi:hypothetical protein MKW92_000278, partial [Papaver armeniacum]
KHYIGGPTATCPHCQAMMWDEERVNKSQKKQPPEFTICCGKGAVKLPLLKEAPEFLKNLMQYVDGGPQASNFRLNIRAYNSMFAFTSLRVPKCPENKTMVGAMGVYNAWA